MATAPLPRPTIWQLSKKQIDATLGKLGHRLNKPLVGEEIVLTPTPTDTRWPVPANAAALPPAFLEGLAHILAEVQPNNLRQMLYHLADASVAWHGTVVKGTRVFVPSLPYPRLEMEFAGTFLLRQLRRHRPVVLQAGPVGLAFDSWSGNYFHWMAEVLPRLLVLRQAQPDCVVLLPGLTPPDYVRQTVAALGFKYTYALTPGELVAVPDLWVAALPGRTGYILPELVREGRATIIAYLSAGFYPARQATRRLYVSRRRQQWRQLTNEEAVEAILVRYGFETIYFEDMTFAQQVQTMYEAAVFIGIHGANMTNVHFMTPGTHAIEMMSNTYLNPSYLAMADSLGVNYWLVPSMLGSPPEVQHNYADITADLVLVEQVVRKVCGGDS